MSVFFGDKIMGLELFGTKKRWWRTEDLLDYVGTKYHCYEELDAELKEEKLKNLKYNMGHFNELDLIKLVQTNNKTVIQLTYFPPGIYFSDRFIKNLSYMKKEIIKLKKEHLKDEKNQGFKIRLHNRVNYTIGAITLLIWK